MRLLSYCRTRLLLGAGLGGAAGFMLCFYIWIVMAASSLGKADGPNPVMLVAGPVAMIFVGLFVWRGISRAGGDQNALVADAVGMSVTTLWGQRRIEWSELGTAEIAVYRHGMVRVRQLVLRYYRDGSSRTARLPLALMVTPSGGYNRLVDQIEEARTDAARRPAPVPGAAASGRGFDADAAMDRYLAQRGAGTTAEPLAAVAASGGTPRRGFGRKGL